MHTENMFELIFQKAKATDEFEYVMALLDFQGAEDTGWNPLQETIYIYDDLTSLLTAPLKDNTRTRLALLLYCHITEAEAPYRIVYNMLTVISGDRCSSFPFQSLIKNHPDGNIVPPTVRNIIRLITELSATIDVTEFAELISKGVDHGLRNAFYHSDYTLHDGEFRSKNSWFTHANNNRSRSLSSDELQQVVNNGLSSFNAFMKVYTRHRLSYKSEITIPSRFASDDTNTPMRVLGDRRRGLYGVTSV